jgi:predicted ArsR family transcriptional regulator
VIPARPGRLRNVEAAGRAIGQELAPRSAEPGDIHALQSTLVALGFQPKLQQQTPKRTTLHLGNCPYRDAVRENQPVVCTLHRGITLGLLDVLDPHAKLINFEPRDPDIGGCVIEFSGRRANPTAT